MYDVLVYLFENCQQAEVSDDRERVARKLSAAGFEDSDISEALHWLAGVARMPREVAELPDARHSFRAFAPRPPRPPPLRPAAPRQPPPPPPRLPARPRPSRLPPPETARDRARALAR